MFDLLLILGVVGNCVAILLYLFSMVSTIIVKKDEKRKEVRAIQLPIYQENSGIIKLCYFVSLGIWLIAWLLFSSTGSAPFDSLGTTLFLFGFAWAVLIIVSIVFEIIVICIKGNKYYTVRRGIFMSLWFAVVYLLLSFLIA